MSNIVSKQLVGLIAALLWGIAIGGWLHLDGASIFFLIILAVLATYGWTKMGVRPVKTQIEQQTERVRAWMKAHPDEAAKLQEDQKSEKVA